MLMVNGIQMMLSKVCWW